MFLKSWVLILIFIFSTLGVSSQVLEKKYLQNKSYDYTELDAAYNELAIRNNSLIRMPWGMTDAGIPLELALIQAHDVKKEGLLLDSNTLVMMVLNGIHAGESCGVDASLHWAEELLKRNRLPENVLIVIVPQYNIGGSLNRSCCTRANQNGPINQGFRGNGQNLDLNRDFMKADSDNAKSFQSMMQFFDPDILVDTHSTNGADYQYTMTLIPYQFEKWPQPLQNVGEIWFDELKKNINKEVKTSNYVNVWGTTPDKGFSAFEVSSLFSGGYAGLFRTLNFTAEAHMFKSYPERVEATVKTLQSAFSMSVLYRNEIKKARKEALLSDLVLNKYTTKWMLDSTQKEVLQFEGYKADFFTSKLTGQERYSYDRTQPISYPADYYPSYKAVCFADVPMHYYLHRGNHKIISMLENNGVEVKRLQRDTTINCFVDFVSNITFASAPYEGHFPHSEFTLTRTPVNEQFLKGDYMISARQKSIRYILEALEAESPGSFFRWNVFDTYLQQKEWFSDYIFEEKAIAFLAANPSVKAEFNELKSKDADFSKSAFHQLYWIYKKTPYYEKEHNRIPVFRVF